LDKVSKFEAADILKAKAEEQKPDPERSYEAANARVNYERVSGEVVDAIAAIMKAGK